MIPKEETPGDGRAISVHHTNRRCRAHHHALWSYIWGWADLGCRVKGNLKGDPYLCHLSCMLWPPPYQQLTWCLLKSTERGRGNWYKWHKIRNFSLYEHYRSYSYEIADRQPTYVGPELFGIGLELVLFDMHVIRPILTADVGVYQNRLISWTTSLFEPLDLSTGQSCKKGCSTLALLTEGNGWEHICQKDLGQVYRCFRVFLKCNSAEV